ncbi:hypothetical protein GmRootV59_53500 (plasmid) [Variovorax sp. V59]
MQRAGGCTESLSGEYVNLMREQQQALTESAAADLDDKLGAHLAALARAARELGADGFTDPAARQRVLRDGDCQRNKRIRRFRTCAKLRDCGRRCHPAPLVHQVRVQAMGQRNASH